MLNASFQNFEDIAYNIKAKGEIDVAKIYKVFSRKGLDVKAISKQMLLFKENKAMQQMAIIIS
jgi:AsmA protein